MRATHAATAILLIVASASCRSAPDASAKGTAALWSPREGKELIGQNAPEWTGIEWIDTPPITLSDLRGKVVLVRFWLTGCPYCRATAPALRELDERYRERGLVVVGIHHPKSDAARELDVVRTGARELGFRFAVGTDRDWQTVRAYGVGTTFRRYTSVSFLIDKHGRFRFVHDGGEFHRDGGPDHTECNAAYAALGASIEAALRE